jgi:hypothetical protein
MDARRAKVAKAQLLARGFTQEQVDMAIEIGPDGIAALNAMGPSTHAPNATARSSVATDLPPPKRFQAALPVQHEPICAPCAPATLDISWMYQHGQELEESEKLAENEGKKYANETGIVMQAFECQCCFDDVPEMTGLQMSPGAEGCDHCLCPACFKRMITGQIEQKEPCTCPICPATDKSFVPSWLVKQVLGDEMALELSKIEQLHIGQADGGQLRFWQCPTPDCTNRQLVDEDFDPEQVADGQRCVNCESCKKRICVRCNVEEHSGFTCEQFRAWKRANDSSERSYAKMLQDGLIKPCPNCAAPILKNEGCNFMSCPTCNDKDRMCWVTGKKRYGRNGCGGGHNCH